MVCRLTKDKERGAISVNAYQGKKNRLAAAVLAAVMLAVPVGALAAETSAHVPGSQAAQETVQKLKPFGKVEAFDEITVSREWLRQARLCGVLINLRLHTPMGDEVTFKEKVDHASTRDGNACLYMQASINDEVITLQMDQEAINTLKRIGITEIVVADKDLNVRACYAVSELQAVRDALGLGEKEQLCVSGEDAPVTVVSEDGVRRQVN